MLKTTIKSVDCEGESCVSYTCPSYMQKALELARYAQSMGEVPVGAVLVHDNEVIAGGWNQPISSNDPTAHAEIVALRNGAKALNNYRLINTTLYVTLEPCVMCLGAMVHARIGRLIFGAYDPKAGAVCSVFNLLAESRFNHKFDYCGGCLEQESAKLLRDFFQARR